MKYVKIDPKTASVEEIRAEIGRLKALTNELKNEEQAYKLLSNSLYGGLGNQYFVAFNPKIAEAITLQGQDLIKYSDEVMNDYFHNHWHLDKELHEKLGITGEVRRVKSRMAVYGDTDSLYVVFDDVIESAGGADDPKGFILKLNEFRLKAYLDQKFEDYAKKWNTKNYQDFELESISESGIWLAKKKYILNIIWDSGLDVEPLSQVIYKGVELAQSSTPVFARKRLDEIIKFILKRKKDLQLREVVQMLRTMKTEFKMAEPETAASGRSINDYRSYVVNDSTALEVVKGIPIHVRAAACYNYTLNSVDGGKYKGKYELIRSGDKIKYYYAKPARRGDSDIFGFIPGSYPYEFAPAIDYDMQFTKTVIDPINRIMEAMDLPQISSTLFMVQPLF